MVEYDTFLEESYLFLFTCIRDITPLFLLPARDVNLAHFFRAYKTEIRSWWHMLLYYNDFSQTSGERKIKVPSRASKSSAPLSRKKDKVANGQKQLMLATKKT